MPNSAIAFRALTPSEARSYGAVVATHPDGTSSVRGPTGATYRAQGTAAVGTAVWVKGGRIESEAPAMPAFEVEID